MRTSDMSIRFKIKKDFLPSLNVVRNISVLNTVRTDIVDAWFSVAHDNIVSANILLENKQIPHSVFFIEQSIECVIKGLFLENGIAEPNNVRDINHHAFYAFRTYYEKVNDNFGLSFSKTVTAIINKGNTFYEKLDLCAQIANVLTADYNNNINVQNIRLSSQYNPSALGLEDKSSQIDCHLRIYKIYYFQYLLLLLSYLFSHDVELNARYPRVTDDNVELPCSSFNESISENLALLIIIITNIISEIQKESLNIMFWSSDDTATR